MFTQRSLLFLKVNMIFSTLIQPSLLPLTWSKRLNALILLSVNVAFLEHAVSYSPSIMVISFAFETWWGLHTAVWFQLIVIFDRDVLIMLTLASHVVTQEVIILLNVSFGHFAWINGVKWSIEILLGWTSSLVHVACICISSVCCNLRMLKHTHICQYSLISMLCYISYRWDRGILVCCWKSLLCGCCTWLFVALIMSLSLSISCLQAHFEILPYWNIKLVWWFALKDVT